MLQHINKMTSSVLAAEYQQTIIGALLIAMFLPIKSAGRNR